MSKLSPGQAGPAASATNFVMAALRGKIDEGALEPGLALRHDELAARFGTCRIPVRLPVFVGA